MNLNPYTVWMVVNIARYAAIVGVFLVAYLFAKEKLNYGWLIFVGVLLDFCGDSLKHIPDQCPYCGKLIQTKDVIKED